MKASILPIYPTPLPKAPLFSLPMASIPTLSPTLPTLSPHSSPHSSPNHCTLPPTSLFGTRITLPRAAISSFRSLPNTNCRATSATVSFSLPNPKPHSGATEKTPKWSARAIKSFAMGELEARKLKYPNTGTEALLMGILVEGTSKAAKFLRANGITLFKVREEIMELLGKSDMYFFSPEHPPLTEPAQKALDWAIEEKLKSGEGGEINVTHILLGIWSQKESAGQQILVTLGFNDEKAKELAKTIDGDVDLSFKRQA
ncbi:ATP-dependent Clp protease ATP-binding subunit CLPT1, chloroplastic [Cajanus cajan]|uniref:ATP-dependent Clp protease ATP-binding subunit n=1 Tax=Cajanus cajan TaxID=3821 RepID=A0A151T481_CAJCA|nr:ATP-dependent Clp protease ATP-binding subunit CLPT1, chloroplastic [Cajanus cajan]KYP61849.1 putative ATP-dependent Clp protease ATP-binding subunit [Cajanus cajan]